MAGDRRAWPSRRKPVHHVTRPPQGRRSSATLEVQQTTPLHMFKAIGSNTLGCPINATGDIHWASVLDSFTQKALVVLSISKALGLGPCHAGITFIAAVVPTMFCESRLFCYPTHPHYTLRPRGGRGRLSSWWVTVADGCAN